MISPKLFTTALKDVMRRLEWGNDRVKIDARQLHHLRFADNIVLITSSISQAERMLADFDKACGKVGLRLNHTKTMFIKNGFFEGNLFDIKRVVRIEIVNLISSFIFFLQFFIDCFFKFIIFHTNV